VDGRKGLVEERTEGLRGRRRKIGEEELGKGNSAPGVMPFVNQVGQPTVITLWCHQSSDGAICQTFNSR